MVTSSKTQEFSSATTYKAVRVGVLKFSGSVEKSERGDEILPRSQELRLLISIAKQSRR
jgi:hypothetical protein